jgi:hypothetical protein
VRDVLLGARLDERLLDDRLLPDLLLDGRLLLDDRLLPDERLLPDLALPEDRVPDLREPDLVILPPVVRLEGRPGAQKAVVAGRSFGVDRQQIRIAL